MPRVNYLQTDEQKAAMKKAAKTKQALRICTAIKTKLHEHNMRNKDLVPLWELCEARISQKLKTGDISLVEMWILNKKVGFTDEELRYLFS